MKRAAMASTVCLALTACGGFGPAGARLAAPDATLTAPCAHPSRHLDAGDWEIVAGRIGDDLILCSARQAALSEWAKGVAGALAPR